MTISVKEVEKLAILSCISLEPIEKENYARQLGAILDYTDCLGSVDSRHTKPLIHILPVFNVYREDEVKTGPTRDQILANAPLAEEGHYRVPRII